MFMFQTGNADNTIRCRLLWAGDLAVVASDSLWKSREIKPADEKERSEAGEETG